MSCVKKCLQILDRLSPWTNDTCSSVNIFHVLVSRHVEYLASFSFYPGIYCSSAGAVGCTFSLYFYICLNSRKRALLLCCYSIAPCTCEDGISASANSYVFRLILVNWYIDSQVYRSFLMLLWCSSLQFFVVFCCVVSTIN